jgi:uncharacterized damage-inducible protein DinB
MTATALLIEQLEATFSEDGWFVATRNAIRGISGTQASWKCDGVDHSILETLAHLNFYNERHLRRLRGETVAPGPARIAETFSSSTRQADSAWRCEKARFTRVMAGWIELLDRTESRETARRRRAPRGRVKTSTASVDDPASWAPVVTHLTLHNAYHCGQIVMLRKLQGNWDPARGISA